MKTEIELNKMIVSITNKIREKYPELLNYLNEMRVTIPCEDTPLININILSSYYNSLVNLIKRYEDTSETVNLRRNRYEVNFN